MEAACFVAGAMLRSLLPPEVYCPERLWDLGQRHWSVLALTREGCRRMAQQKLRFSCDLFILPGEWGVLASTCCRAHTIVTCGLSPRESLTFSSLGESSMLCVQRMLPRPDGGWVEPQEIPVPSLSCPAEDYLAAAALQLLLK